MAELTEKWVKKTWSRTSSTGKALLKEMKEYEKAEKALDKNGATAQMSKVTGSLKTLDRMLDEAVKTYKKKKDKKMLAATEELADLVTQRSDELQKTQFDTMAALEGWVERREKAKKDTSKLVAAFAKHHEETTAALGEMEALAKEAAGVHVAGDPASVTIIKGKASVLEEDIDVAGTTSAKEWAALKSKSIDDLRMETPDKFGLTSAAIKPVEKLWHECSELFAAIEKEIAGLRADHSEAVSVLELINGTLTEGADATATAKKTLAKTLTDIEKKLRSAESTISKWPGSVRIFEGYVSRDIKDALDKKDTTLVDGVEKGVALRLSELDRREPELRSTLEEQVALLDRAVARVPAAVWSGDGMSDERTREAAIRERAAEIESDMTDVIRQVRAKAEEVEKAAAAARKKLG